MSTLPQSKPHLLSLPNEILAKICFEVATLRSYKYWDPFNPHHISNLRLTCRHLHVPATRELARNFLTIPTVMYARSSLEHLVELCKHPLFGPHVVGVNFHTCRLSASIFDEITSCLHDSAHRGNLEDVRRRRKDLNNYLELYGQERDLDQSDEAEKLLAKALSLLHSYGKAPSISLPGISIKSSKGQRLGDSIRPWGYPKAVDKFLCTNGHWRVVMGPGQLSRSLMILLKSAVTSGVEIPSLDLQMPDSWVEEAVPTEPDLQIVCKALTALKTLRADLSNPFLLESLIDILQATLPHAGTLERVYLHGYDLRDDQSHLSLDDTSRLNLARMGSILQSCQSGALVQIKLECLDVRETDFLKLLEAHKHTLRALSLIKIVLDGCWTRFLFWIRENLSLEKLALLRLQYIYKPNPGEDTEILHTGWWLGGGFSAEGVSDTRSELFDILKLMERERSGEEVSALEWEEYEIDYDEYCEIRAWFDE